MGFLVATLVDDLLKGQPVEGWHVTEKERVIFLIVIESPLRGRYPFLIILKRCYALQIAGLVAEKLLVAVGDVALREQGRVKGLQLGGLTPLQRRQEHLV